MDQKKRDPSKKRGIHNWKEYLWVFMLFFSFFLIFFMVSSLTYWKVNRNTKEKLETEIAQSLNEVTEIWEHDTQRIYESGYKMLNNEAFSRLIPSQMQSDSRGTCTELINWMEMYQSTTSMYSDVSFLYYDDRYVITNQGMDEFPLYFNVRRVHENNKQQSWEELLQKSDSFQTLPMDTVTEKYSGIQKRWVLPVVLAKNINGHRVVLVTEVSADKLQEMFQEHSTNENQLFLCLDPDANVFFSTTEIELQEQEREQLNDLLDVSPMVMKNYQIGGTRYQLAAKTGALGLNYFMFTPISQLHREIFNTTQFMLLFFLMTMVLFFILTLIYTRRIYHPLRNVVQKLSLIQPENASGVEYIGKNFPEKLDQLCADNTTLLANQRTLIYKSFDEAVRSILRGKPVSANDMCLEYLARIGIDPENLTCFILQIDFCRSYYRDFSEQDRGLVKESLPVILSQLLSTAGFNVVQDTSNRCICFFSKEKHLQERLENAVQSIYMLFSFDAEYCRIKTGLASGCCKTSGDVRRVLLEAATALRQEPQQPMGQLCEYDASKMRLNLLFTPKERNQLVNYASTGEADKLFALLDKIIQDNKEAAVHEGLIQLLYSELYHIGYEILITAGWGKPERAEHIWQSVLCMEQKNDMHEPDVALKEFYKLCIHLTQENHAQDDTLESILSYVKQHFAEEIYLEKIAEALGIHPKYLSRIFKERTGVNLSEYVSLLRITKAKELLETSQKSVGEIGELVGFENRTTFFRSFKKMEGVSPNEYRKLSQK